MEIQKHISSSGNCERDFSDMRGKKVKFNSRQEAQRDVAVRRAEHFALNSTPSGVVPSEGYSQKIAGPFRIANEILSQGKRGRDSDIEVSDG